MVWQQWVLIGYFVLAVALSVASVGKPRRPLPASSAAWSVVISAAVIAMVVSI